MLRRVERRLDRCWRYSMCTILCRHSLREREGRERERKGGGGERWREREKGGEGGWGEREGER